MERGKAFTLLELLVVVAIILILGALLLPALSAGRKKARTASCLSQLRQIGISFEMYGGDTGYYPPGNNVSTQWDKVISIYTSSESDNPYSATSRGPLYLCPSATRWTKLHRSNYAANKQILADISVPYNERYEEMARPHESIMVADAIQYAADGSSHALLWGTRNAAGAQIGDNDGNTAAANKPIRTGADEDKVYAVNDTAGGDFRYRHLGPAANVVFADGHCQTFTKGSILERNMYTNY